MKKERIIPPRSGRASSLLPPSLLLRPASSLSPSISTSPANMAPRKSSVLGLGYALALTVTVLCFTPVQSRWCTRLVTYTTIKPYVETTTCNQSYQEACGFWTYAMCTRYEEVPCMVERNKTLTQYKIYETCCPGYRLNPLNNLTCESIETDNGEKVQEEVTSTKYPKATVTQSSPSQAEMITNPVVVGESTVSVSGRDRPAVTSGDGRKNLPGPGSDHRPGPPAQGSGGSSPPTKKSSNKSIGEEGHDGRVEFYQSENEGKLFGLTKGAYAGIVCSVAFLVCVVVLVSIRLYKRQRNNRLKAQKKQQMEMEASQSMMPNKEPGVQA